MLKGGSVTFAFPEGHPHETKARYEPVPGIVFEYGKFTCGREEAMRLEATLYHHHQAAVEGSADFDALQAEFDANPAIQTAIAKRKSDEDERAKNAAMAAQVRAERAEKRRKEAAEQAKQAKAEAAAAAAESTPVDEKE